MKTYYRVLSYVKPYWKHLSISVFCSIMYAVLSGATIYLTIPLLESLFQEGSKDAGGITEKIQTSGGGNFSWFTDIIAGIKETFTDFMFSGTSAEILLKICVMILIAFLGKNIFGFFQSYFLAYVEQGVIKDLRNSAYKHLHKLPMSFFKNEKTGNLISRIMNDVTVVQSSVSAVFLNMIREPITITVLLIIAFSISAELTLFSLTVLPFSLLIIGWIGLKLKKQSAILQEKMSDITTVLHETISGVKIVKAFGMEKYENKKFNTHTYNFFRLILRMTRVRNSAAPLTEFLSVIVGVVVIYYGGQMVLEEGSITASEFLGFLFAIFQLMPPIKELSGVNNRIQEASAAAERVFEILDIEPSIKNVEKPIVIDDFKETFEFNNVSYQYEDSEELVLKNISFTAKKGQIIALVGSSGAGKTTLVDLIPRFYDPVKGSVLVDGNDIRYVTFESLRKLMGIVTQETVLFNESVRNNIAYGLDEFPESEIIRAAKAANAHDFIMELSKGYDTIIGERGTKLSGGQRQRISIARALLKNPPIMIFDEATSALDNESEVLVQEAIERLMSERTTFVIAHRLSTIRNADRILVLDRGEIVQDGKHEELLKDASGVYKKLYELQFRD